MVKSIHYITIRDYSLFEKTGDARTLIKGRRYKKPDLDRLLEEISRGLGSETDQNKAFEKEKHRVKSLYRIEYLVTLYQAAYNLLMNKTRIDAWKALIGRDKGSDYTNLIEYVEKIKEATGIEINPDSWDDDMLALKFQIDLWTDRYNENFRQVQQGDSLTFMQIVLGVFAALQFPINEDICLSDFFEMKRQAEDVIKQLNKQADGRQH